MPYHITAYTYKKAKRLGLQVKPARQATKKLDVFRRGKKLASVGFYGMNDYPTYVQTRGRSYANKRRRLYKMRHEKDRHIKNSRGWFADQLLWWFAYNFSSLYQGGV